jgi:hypothetical protein
MLLFLVLMESSTRATYRESTLPSNLDGGGHDAIQKRDFVRLLPVRGIDHGVPCGRTRKY